MKRSTYQLPPSIKVTPGLVQIEKPLYGGAFLVRIEGKAVFVPLVLPGEQARVRIVEDKRGYATAEAEEIVGVAPERVKPVCAHFGACGGCHYQHAGYDTQLKLKQDVLRETLERGGVQVPKEIEVLFAEPWGYRNRIRLAIDTQGRLGYRGRRSHAVVPVSECPIAAPLLIRAATVFSEAARQIALGFGLTEIALFCNAEETSLLATLFTARPTRMPVDDLGTSFADSIPALRGIEFVAAGRTGQPPGAFAKWGAASLLYHAADIDYRVDNGAFFQVNRWLVDALAARVTEGPLGTLAWDLFAGVGLFARKLTARFSRVVAVESAPAATTSLEQNLRGTTGTNVKADALAFLRRNRTKRPDLIVLDPPRTGLCAETTALLGAVATPELVYVSCDPATLARDLRALTGFGYAIESVTLADLFPQTFHLETVVRLRRA